MAAAFTTIGHSTRQLDEFIAILQAAAVRLLIDVRSFPRSRTNPDYNIVTLPEELESRQISYLHMPALGGRRPKQKQVDDQLNAMWRVQSFHNYADYALGEKFTKAFAQLVKLGSKQRVTIMCAEAMWWRCHRRIITDYLLLNGHPVDHLMREGHSEAARPTPGAERRADGKIIYPANLLL